MARRNKRYKKSDDDNKMRKLYIRNWIIAIISLGIAIIAYNMDK